MLSKINVKLKILLTSFMAIVFLYPAVSFSAVTLYGEYCHAFTDNKNIKNEKKLARLYAIRNALNQVVEEETGVDDLILDDCIDDMTDKYFENINIISHTEKKWQICEKVSITIEPEVIKKYINTSCKNWKDITDQFGEIGWNSPVIKILKKEKGPINIALIVETKKLYLNQSERDKKEYEVEEYFYKTVSAQLPQVKIVDRRNLNNILEEQKLSASGITDSDTVKIGKLLNLDIIVLRMYYPGMQVTKMMKVATGQILFMRTYE